MAPVVKDGIINDIQLITGGGSRRAFYRVQCSNGSYILQVTENIHELSDYMEIGDFFYHHGVNVPRLLSGTAPGGVALFEDAGDVSLRSVVMPLLDRGEHDAVKHIYRQAIDQLLMIQAIPFAKAPATIRERAFDSLHYKWESDYFLENCAGNYFKESAICDPILGQELDEMVQKLLNEPLFVVHRDFQSENIHLKEDRIILLDYQSARIGSMFYDLASLLRDPYVFLPWKIHDELFDYYLEVHQQFTGREDLSPQQAKQIYNLVSVQRLMQALGAYGKLGLVDRKARFLQFIPPALEILYRILHELAGLRRLRRLVEKMRDTLEVPHKS